jgi:hypothetical protein
LEWLPGAGRGLTDPAALGALAASALISNISFDSAQARSPHARARAHAHATRLAVVVWASDNSGVSEHPRCAAVLQGGERCRSVAVTGSDFCQHHDAVAAAHGAEVVKLGNHLPTPRKRLVQAPVEAELAAMPATSNGVADPASVRPRLAEAAAASVEDIRRVLVETATGANKQLWATISCKHCARAGRYEITVPDNKVRLDAVQALLHEALGRPGQAEPQPAPAFPRTAEEARNLSWDELTLVFATYFADEISAVVGSGDELLRTRLASLSKDERRVLREALLEPELA